MHNIKNEFKEVGEFLSKRVNLNQIIDEYGEKGYIIFENIFSENLCNEFINKIDELEQEIIGHEVNYGGTELRIWKAHNKNKIFEEFKFFSDNISSKVFSKDMSAFDILAIRNRSIKQVKKDVSSGRWHIDSFSPQFKAFLFLTKTNEESGPFEFIPGSNKFPFKLKSALKGEYFSPKDFVKGGRKYQHISNEYVDIVKQAEPSKPLLVSKGTLVFIDTSCY